MSTTDTQLIRITYDLLDFCRSFEDRQKGWRKVGDELVRDVVIVYNGIDRIETIIDPRGYVGDPSIVISDYDHNAIQTGAYLTNFRVLDTLEIEGLDGQKQILRDVLVAEDHIPKSAKCFFWVRGVTPQGQVYKTGQKASNGSMYEQALNNQLNAVSVDFAPIKKYKNKNGEIEDGIVFDPATGITTYRYWDLRFVSHLDVAAGQQFSGFVRSIETINEPINQNIFMSTEPQTPLEGNTEVVATDTQTTPETVVTETVTTPTDDTQRATKPDEKESAAEEAKESPADEAKEDEMSLPNLHKRMGDYNSRLANCERMLTDLSAPKKRDDTEDSTDDTTRSQKTETTDKELTPETVEAITNHLRTLKIEPNQPEGEPAKQFEDDQPQDNGSVSTERAVKFDEQEYLDRVNQTRFLTK